VKILLIPGLENILLPTLSGEFATDGEYIFNIFVVIGGISSCLRVKFDFETYTLIPVAENIISSNYFKGIFQNGNLAYSLSDSLALRIFDKDFNFVIDVPYTENPISLGSANSFWAAKVNQGPMFEILSYSIFNSTELINYDYITSNSVYFFSGNEADPNIFGFEFNVNKFLVFNKATHAFSQIDAGSFVWESSFYPAGRSGIKRLEGDI
jgi:hypothetical protein